MLGVPADKIYRDSGSYRTLDSVLRARCIFGQQSVLVISQRAHVVRALFLAWSAGLKDEGAAADGPPHELAARDARRESLARLRAIYDVKTRQYPPCDGPTVTIGRGHDDDATVTRSIP